MTALGRRTAALLLAPLLLGIASCASDGFMVLTDLEAVVAGGDGQFGTTGSVLATPLRVVVRSASGGQAQEGVQVAWRVESGDASLLGSTTVVTGADGTSEVSVRLGVTPGEVDVSLEVVDQPSARASFTVFAVDEPVLDSVAPVVVEAGDTVTFYGANFSPVADQNVVLFSGIGARVLTASTETLTVEVPRCLPALDVDVRMQLGTVATASRSITVTGGSEVTTLAVGQVVDITDDSGLTCIGLPGTAGAEYLTLVYSGGTVGAVSHSYTLTALSSSVAPGAAAGVGMLRSEATPSGDRREDAQTSWERLVRAREERLLDGGHDPAGHGPTRSGSQGPARAAGADRGAAPVPSLGETRTFSVWAGGSSYEQVTAVARWVGSEGAIFVDQNAPSGGFSDSELEAFSDRFDEVIHPRVTGAFGAESDLDGNGRVIILFTPVVNGLTPPGASGFVGGFFFGADLLEGEDSNGGEVFYALVPDPTGAFGDARDKSDVLEVVPAVLAHEFQHMVHFNQRYLILDGGQDALWMRESLAQMAEEVVARFYAAQGDDDGAELFRAGARIRARRYLAGTDTVSVIASVGQGTLAERGGGFLNLLYLEDQYGGDLLRELTADTLTGVANVVDKVGITWPAILGNWWSAIYLDEAGSSSGPLAYPTVDLKGFLAGPENAPFPVTPFAIDEAGASLSGSLWSSSAAYYIVSPATDGFTALRLGGEAGGVLPPQAALRLRIIRIS